MANSVSAQPVKCRGGWKNGRSFSRLCSNRHLQQQKCSACVVPPSYSLQNVDLGGAEKANSPTNLHDVKTLCAHQASQCRALYGTEEPPRPEAGSPLATAKGRKPQGKQEVLPRAQRGVGKAMSSSAPFPEAGRCRSSSCRAARERVLAA